MKNDKPQQLSILTHRRHFTEHIPSAPYVGVNAPMTVDEVKRVGYLYRRAEGLLPPDAAGLVQPFLGLMVSNRILTGEQMKSKWASQYPSIDQIPVLMDAAREAGMKCFIHYNTKNPKFCDELEELERRWNRVPDGWQLNIVWPDPRELERYLGIVEHARVQFIAQVGGKAYDMVGQRPDFMARRLRDYDALASYFLFDLSGGVGKTLDPNASLEVVAAMHEQVGGGVAVAGGLGPDTVGLLRPIAKALPLVSWDAQGRLRDQNDQLDLKNVEGYLVASYSLYAEVWRELGMVP